MSEIWLYLKKSCCKSQSSEVHDPKKIKHDKRKNSLISPKSQAKNNVMVNHVTHDIVLDSKSGEIKICPSCYPPHGSTKGTTIVSTKTCFDWDECFSKPKVTIMSNDSKAITSPHKFGDKLKALDTIEEQDISEHSVVNLHREDSSWQIIKKICEGSNVNGEIKTILQIECVLKVQNMKETFTCFEEFREMVKINAEKLQIKHPRSLVDGNEMLRFHGTTIACSIGINDSSMPCTLDQCGLCHILRLGFSTNEECHGTFGVLTTSTFGKAIDSIGCSNKPFVRKCVIVCRVIAGRINNPLQEIQEMNDLGYDSLVKNISSQLDVEELIVLNPRGVLPCFVVIYKL